MHRGIGLVAAVFLLVVALSGLWLAYESLYMGFYMGSAQQRADVQAFADAQKQRLAGLPTPTPRLDPMSAEAQSGRQASMQHDIGLNPEEVVKIKAITDNSVKKDLELHKPGVDPQEARGKLMSLHQDEANAIMAVLTDDQKPRFEAWRAAQLLGMPVNMNNGSQRPGGQQGPGGPGGGNPNAGAQGSDASLPLQDLNLVPMLLTTIGAEGFTEPNSSIKVIRLRYYAGMPQGIVVTGGATTKQLVFNTNTGKPVSETEPGYPPTGFPFGWQAHQIAKDIHRGGIIGVPGRLMDLFSGLALLYLSINGIALYVDLWKERKREGHIKPFWVHAKTQEYKEIGV
jgi:hypothetical protein